MICFIVLWFLISSLGSLIESSPEKLNRIIGGQPADIREVPYQLFLEINNGAQIIGCGASIIGPLFAVSAAHCVYGQKNEHMLLRAGSSLCDEGGELHYVQEVTIHPDYNYFTDDYDVCVLKVTEPFTYSATVQPIELATETPGEDTLALASGWGATNCNELVLSKNLQKVTLPVYSHARCELTYGTRFTPRMLCAGYTEGGKSVYSGDSGGPLVAQNKLIGISSWVVDCASPYLPAVFANVANLRNWITKTVCKMDTTK